MRTLLAFLLLTMPVFAAQNAVKITSTGNNQNITVTQVGNEYHSAGVKAYGDDVNIQITQQGPNQQGISITVDCTVSCTNNPYIINQQ
jgi:hypothetical protein